MNYVNVATQEELDALLVRGNKSERARLIGAAWFRFGGSAHVVAWESAHVVASQYVGVHQHSDAAVIVGGTVIRVKPPTNPVEWCAFYGAAVKDGVAIVYKGVRDDYRSGRGFLYAPGTTQEAPDWDGRVRECGGGLHFSPHPGMTRRTCGPVYEVDRFAQPVKRAS